MNLRFLLVLLLLTGCSGGKDALPLDPVLDTLEPAFSTPVQDQQCIDRPNPLNRFNSLISSVQSVRNADSSIKDGEILPYCDQLQMDPPDSCPATATSTGHPWYPFMACDGVLQRTEVDFMFSPGNTQQAIIDILAVVDSKLTIDDREGLSYEQYVQREVDFANDVFFESGVYITLRLVGVELVEVDTGDLRTQYYNFANSRNEFDQVDNWQRQHNADIAFLFKQIEDEPISCGVASFDATRGIKYSRGITQCFQNSVFQPDYLRYYNRANETFVHEIGHILGLEHDFGNHSGSASIFEYSFGYVIPNSKQLQPDGNYDSGFGTIMSYADQPTQSFSSTDLFFELPDGRFAQTGTSGQFGLGAPEDLAPETQAVEHLNRVRYIMSQLAERDHVILSLSYFYESIESSVCMF